MKNASILLSLIVLIFVGVYWQNSSRVMSSDNKQITYKSSEISSFIDKFRLTSLQGNSEDLEKLITKIPADYYEMLNKCDEKNGETEKRRNSNEAGLNWITRGVTQSQIDREYAEILKTSSNIKQKNYDSFRILEIKEVDNHAIVKVEYGKEDFRPYVELFLLSKENGEWKAFANTLSWHLLLDNKYFANKDCAE
jgi:Domain of unknown function (DUF4878)